MGRSRKKLTTKGSADREPLGDALRRVVHDCPAFARLDRSLGQGRHVVARDVPTGAQPAVIAALAEERPLLVVVPEADAARALGNDLELLSGDGLCCGARP